MPPEDVIRYYRHFRKGPLAGPDVIPVSKVRYLCITDPSATEHAEYCYPTCPVRLACLSHAASVRSEPGSNSSLIYRCIKRALARRCVRLELVRRAEQATADTPGSHNRLHTKV